MYVYLVSREKNNKKNKCKVSSNFACSRTFAPESVVNHPNNNTVLPLNMN